MKTLCLHPVRCHASSDANPFFSVSSDECHDSPMVLWLTKQNELRISPAAKVGRKPHRIASLLFRQAANENSQWLLTPLSDQVIHNGIRPFTLAVLEPGDVLACQNQSWLTSELWRPTPSQAPEAVAEKECSVCGGPLNLAPVIQCPCGRYYHLEKPETPDDPQALNCYLTAGMCGLCERKPSLDPQFLPIPPEELIPQETLETAIASV